MLVDTASLSDFLSDLDLFNKLDEESLNLLIEGAHTRLYKQGELIYAAGDDAIDFYVIYSGKYACSANWIPGKNTSPTWCRVIISAAR